MIRNPFRLPRAGRVSPAGARPAFKLIPVRFGWLTPLLLGPACALALDIGEIQVHSALNQLFDARIPLPTLTPEELGKISVKLAPAPMFKEFDLDRASTLSNLVFSLEYNAEGQVYVKVISTKPIRCSGWPSARATAARPCSMHPPLLRLFNPFPPSPPRPLNLFRLSPPSRLNLNRMRLLPTVRPRLPRRQPLWSKPSQHLNPSRLWRKPHPLRCEFTGQAIPMARWRPARACGALRSRCALIRPSPASR